MHELDTEELANYAVFGGYLALVAVSFIGCFVSIMASGAGKDTVLSGRPFVFIRAAFGAFFCTWYFMIAFLRWSYSAYAARTPNPTVGHWLVNTPLFEQAWRAVCLGNPNWWWSSFICSAAIVFCALIWYQSVNRGIRYPWIFMVFGQMGAISVAIAMFLAAVCVYKPLPRSQPIKASRFLVVNLLVGVVVCFIMPMYAGTPKFMIALLVLHAVVLIPLFAIPLAGNARHGVNFKALVATLLGLLAMVHVGNTIRVREQVSSVGAIPSLLQTVFLSHPAQASVSFDVVWVGIISLIWYMSSGSTMAVAAKSFIAAVVAAVGATRYLGVNWTFIITLVPMAALLAGGGVAFVLNRARTRNVENRARILGKLGFRESGVIPGTDKEPPTIGTPRTVVGFWHPFCNAGGGGERVLWTAIAWLQREDPNVISLVYSGDYPAASKEEILAKVDDRFSIKLSPTTIEFVPLPSRYLVGDTHWKRFTLLGQTLGSIYIAWEGLCGPDGVWGDIFIDSMGYAFVLPFVRLIAGERVAIGSYTHYPTVSADMVKRVRARAGGVEDGGASRSRVRTWIKLAYYAMFTYLYSVALLFSEYTMTNSSWTQAHIESLLAAGRSSMLAKLLLLDDDTQRHLCQVVYPPCDTTELSKLSNLSNRKRELVSLAQFRPEKDHAKQLHALAILLRDHPEYRTDVHLTLMGGSRGDADAARLETLRSLAQDLDIAENVTFLVNASYPELVRRLGEASVGLNTMQDEHFGINVVEFMAAGLIPVVHASAGPLLDIVVPYNGQRTGFHATDAESFAVAIYEALSSSPKQQLAMRQAGRALAAAKFSEAAFESGFEQGWASLVSRLDRKRSGQELR